MAQPIFSGAGAKRCGGGTGFCGRPALKTVGSWPWPVFGLCGCLDLAVPWCWMWIMVRGQQRGKPGGAPIDYREGGWRGGCDVDVGASIGGRARDLRSNEAARQCGFPVELGVLDAIGTSEERVCVSLAWKRKGAIGSLSVDWLAKTRQTESPDPLPWSRDPDVGRWRDRRGP